MSSSQRLPLWLNAALSSERHITTVLGVLFERESKRDVARNASQIRVLEQSNSGKQSPLILLGKRNRDAPPSHIAHYAITAGSLVPQDLNRYMDIIPYDRTRVVVYDDGLGVEHESQGRYLNASWVLERQGGKWWIATQAPVKRSAHTFLSALMQPIISPHSAACRSRVRTVVQLTRNFEGGRRKADAYFPSEVGNSIVIPPDDGHPGIPLKVTLCGLRTIKEAHCIQSTVSILPMVNQDDDGSTNASNIDNVSVDQTVTFKHLLYLSWPDHGIPEDHQSVLSFIHLVEQTNRNSSDSQIPSSGATPQEIDPDPPIMVGCSAGIGRTGSFIAIASLLRGYGFLSPAMKPTPSSALPSSPLGPLPEQLQVDGIAQEIDSLREQRPGMVQRAEQVVLVYEVLARVFGLQL
jgi:protein tyrosine phosphatase